MPSENSAVQLGRRLRRLRTARGLTQAQLAGSNYTHAYVSTIEAGRRYPSAEALEHFAAALGVGSDELVTGRPPGLSTRLELRVQEARLLLSNGDRAESRAMLDQVLREARRHRINTVEALALGVLGACDEYDGNLESAIENYEKSEEVLADEALPSKAYAVAGQARCHHMLGDVRYAIHLLESFLDRMEREGLRDPDALVRAYSPLVLAYFDAGLFEKADATASDALRLANNVEDRGNVAAMHVNVARVLLHQGKYRQAERSLRRAEDLYTELGYATETGVAHLARGYVLTRKGDLDRAERHLLRAKGLLHGAKSKVNEAHALNELGRLYRLRGRLAAAKEILNDSIRILRNDSDASALAWAFRELGTCATRSDPLEAEKYYRRALRIYERTGEAMELASTYRLLGDLLTERGDTVGACNAYRTGITKIDADV